tara:strand:- start:1691 stop:2272 length:582 start_codon:yes stop_codon:yes gene_type:complete
MATVNTPIHQSLIQACKEVKPEWFTTTAFVNEMVSRGLAGLDPCATLGEPEQQTDRPTKSEGSTSKKELYIEDINKVKAKKKNSIFKFDRSSIPFDLDNHAKDIETFWEVKTGKKTQASWSLLMDSLAAIKGMHGDLAVKKQLELAIVGGPKGPWANITLHNYQTFSGRNSQQTQPDNHPASRVFTADGGFQE